MKNKGYKSGFFKWACCLSILWAAQMPYTAIAQSEPESSTNSLAVVSHSKTYQNFRDSTKLSVRTAESKKWIRGRISDVQDSSLVVGGKVVAVSQITELRTTTELSTVFAGIVVLLVAGGIGFCGWIFVRAIDLGRPKRAWEWALVILGLIGVVLFGPALLVTALLAWAFARTKYTIGNSFELQVRHPKKPDTAKNTGDRGIPGF